MVYYVMFISLTYPFKHETNHSGFQSYAHYICLD